MDPRAPDHRVALFVARADDGALRLAGSCALAASAMDRRVDVFLLDEAVRAVVEAHSDPDAPGHRLHQARAAGNCRIFACSESLVGSGIDPAQAETALDAVVGWPTILEWTRGVVDRHFF
jgi:predicted peroxiredoxin